MYRPGERSSSTSATLPSRPQRCGCGSRLVLSIEMTFWDKRRIVRGVNIERTREAEMTRLATFVLIAGIGALALSSLSFAGERRDHRSGSENSSQGGVTVDGGPKGHQPGGGAPGGGNKTSTKVQEAPESGGPGWQGKVRCHPGAACWHQGYPCGSTGVPC